MSIIRRALISVSDKTKIIEFARALAGMKIDILSTGGTAKLLKENKIPVTEVGDYTGQPEILDGRLKTLHPKIHGGILAIRSNPKHQKELKESGIEPIDLVVVNLYPFEEMVARQMSMGGIGGREDSPPDSSEPSGFASGKRIAEAIEQIDIGGPTMIRAAAKNWEDVTVVVDPEDYGLVLEEMKKNGGDVSRGTRFRLAQKVFTMTSRYEGAIANYLTGGCEGKFPRVLNWQGIKVQDLRYGENPHQKAAFYTDVGAGFPRPGAGTAPLQEPSVSNAKQLHGKELSFNNILDLDAALNLVTEFKDPTCVIIKHTNPCGVALTPSSPAIESVAGPSPLPAGRHGARGEGIGIKEVFIAARECDPLSAFGGIIGLNRPVDRETAEEIGKDFYECVIAPSFSPEALEILKGKKNIRLMELPPSPQPSPARGEGVYDMKKVVGGLLVQERDLSDEDVRGSKVVTKRGPTEQEWEALAFAWRVVKHVKSNAIVFAGEGVGILKTLGIGCGQMSRIDSTRIGIQKAVGARSSSGPGGKTPPLQGAVMASDAFFPFRDNVDEAAKAGITAIVQPGGSVRDGESIQAADEQGIAMVFTGVRHFRH